jgi:hypothetical protein
MPSLRTPVASPKTGKAGDLPEVQEREVERAEKTMSKYTMKDLEAAYDEYSGEAIAICTMTRELVGGMPASPEGIRAFCLHHLHIPEGPELDAAVSRITGEELGERDVTPEAGEIKEKETYGLNVIRRSEYGPWIGDWQIKAAIKQAASRVGLFAQKRGTRGDVAEMGKVSAHGISVHGAPFRVHLIDASEDAPAQTFYQKFMGRVTTPSGAKSIVNDAECAPIGSRFAFRFQWFDNKLTEKDIVSIFSALPVVGVGSVKSLERGKFEINELEVNNVKTKSVKAA